MDKLAKEALFILIIIGIICICIVIRSAYITFKYNHRRLDLENTPVICVHKLVYNIALNACKNEFRAKHKRIYKKNSAEYLKIFVRAVDKQYDKCLMRIADKVPITKNTHFNQNFITYTMNFYPDAKQLHLEHIVKEYIVKPKKNQAKYKRTSSTPVSEKCMMYKQYVKLKDIYAFKQQFKRKFGFDEISGIYLIYNATKQKWYVGQGQKAIQRCITHFVSLNDNAPDIKQDFDSGNVFYVNFIRISDTSFNTLDELEYFYIHKYNCLIPYGYNNQNGNRTNKYN